MNKTMILGATILSMTGIFLSGINASAADTISKKSNATVTIEVGAPDYTIKTKDIDFGKIVLSGKQNRVTTDVQDLVTVEGQNLTGDKYDLTVKRSDEMDKTKNIYVLNYIDEDNRGKFLGKDEIVVQNGISGNKWTSGNAKIQMGTDPDEVRTGIFTAELQWTLTPHVNI